MNEHFMRLYRESIHYKAERERNPEASDIALLGYCYESDDFVSPEASDAYAVFKSLYLDNESLKSALERLGGNNKETLKLVGQIHDAGVAMSQQQDFKTQKLGTALSQFMTAIQMIMKQGESE